LGLVRRGLAIVIAAVAVAVYLGSAKLNAHGDFHCSALILTFCPRNDVRWTPTRATWQIPAAIVVAVVGLGAAVVVARRS
jgi:hypothetical protein